MKNFRTVPMTLSEANEFVDEHHRHHGALSFHLASIGVQCRDTNRIVGAATLMRPCSTVLDDRVTIEVARLVTDGTRNACSFLLGASARLAWASGYLRIQTYTMAEESGASLRAAGWRMERRIPPSTWNRMNRPRAESHEIAPRVRWAAFAPEVFSSAGGQDLDMAFFLGEAAGRSGALIDSNPFCPGDEAECRSMWREGWECAEFERFG